MQDNLIALVPMKAHSERVPDKNVREFNGRPLFHWILATLEATEFVDRVLINTDSARIAREAPERFDVEIVERPERLRGDDVSMNRILLHDVQQVDRGIFLQTHCTNPMLRAKTIDEAVETYRSTDSDSLFSVTPHRVRLWDENCEPINHRRDELLPTQHLTPIYEENSNIYVFTRESLERRENRIGATPAMYPMGEHEAVDIDTKMDFRIAEHLHRDRYGDKPTLDEVVEA